MMAGRVEADDAQGIENPPLFVGAKIEADPELLEQIASSAISAGGTVAVLGHFSTRCSHQKRGQRRRVESLLPAAAGSAGVDCLRRQGNGRHPLSHGPAGIAQGFGGDRQTDKLLKRCGPSLVICLRRHQQADKLIRRRRGTWLVGDLFK